MNRLVVSGVDELDEVAKILIPQIEKFRLVCFNGEMGVGKTTLIKAICYRLGVQDQMSSPTFSIVNEYLSSQNSQIYHFDFYRINQVQEALDIGIEEYFYSGNICLIEWPEMIKELIPEIHLKISIKLVGETDREISIIPNG